MSLTTYVFLTIAVLCPVYGYNGVTGNDLDSYTAPNEHSNIPDGNFLATRWKRSSMAKAIGEAAVKALLTNSKQSIFKSEAFTKYVKKGDMSTAWNDFQALNPTNVRQKRLGGGSSIYEAHIGDKRITLSTGDRTHRRTPHITVYDNNGVDSPKRIFYKKKIDPHYYYR